MALRAMTYARGCTRRTEGFATQAPGEFPQGAVKSRGSCGVLAPTLDPHPRPPRPLPLQ